MDNYFNMERVKQAHGLCDKLREYNRTRTEPKKQPKLDNVELSLLMVLARKMGRKTDTTTGEIEDGCRASLVTLEHESMMERTAIGRALGNLIVAGFIAKTYDKDRRGELTKEGLRRKALGLSLVCPEKNNYERRPMGRPRDDKSDMGQWKHCIYHLVPEVWDSVVFDSKEVRVAPAAPLSAEDQATLEEIDLPVATKAPATVTVTGKQLDEVFAQVKRYFGTHPTFVEQSEKDAVRSMSNACKELANRALTLDDLAYAHDFVWWLLKRHNYECVRLMNKVNNLGGPIGLPKSIADLWDEFVPERDDDYGQYGSGDDSDDQASDESEHMEQDFAHKEDEDFDEPVKSPATKAAKPIFDFDDDQEEVEPEPPANQFRGHRQAFVRALRTKTNLLRRPSEGFTIELDSARGVLIGLQAKWLDSVPYGQQIVQERVSPALLRVDIKWNVARYIVEHAEQFILDGYIDELYQPVVEEADRECNLVAA